MAKIFSEDAYCLGLLYSYLFASKKMVLKDDLDTLNSFNLLKDNNILTISEKKQLAYLPYKCSEIEKIYKT